MVARNERFCSDQIPAFSPARIASVAPNPRRSVGMPSRYKTYAPSTKAACGLRHRGLLSLSPPTFRRVGSGVASAYSRFVFGSAGSSRAAFDNECRDYHAFGGSDDGLDNEHHPVPPSGSLWECVGHGH